MSLKKASKTRFGKKGKIRLKGKGYGHFGNKCKLGEVPSFDKEEWEKQCEEVRKKRRIKRNKIPIFRARRGVKHPATYQDENGVLRKTTTSNIARPGCPSVRAI